MGGIRSNARRIRGIGGRRLRKEEGLDRSAGADNGRRKKRYGGGRCRPQGVAMAVVDSIEDIGEL